MILFPSAKINLGLYVLGKRPDGYHNILTVMYPIPVNDILEVLPAKEFIFKQTGAEIPGDQFNNLVVKAWQLMQKKYAINPIYVHLRKIIPMGAGLGGGSSDAAYMIRALNEFYHLDLSIQEMKETAAELGSDCPFFIEDSPQIASGRGEQLRTIEMSLSDYTLKIVAPKIHVSTAEAYQNVAYSDFSESELIDILKSPVEEWREHLRNDFEISLFTRHPELAVEKKKLYDQGAIYASMTGSGSALYGIFPKGSDDDSLLPLQD